MIDPSPKRLLSVQAVTVKRLLSVEETATYLGLSPRTIYNGVAPGSKNPFPVKAKRIGKLVRFDIRDLDKFCEGLTGDGGNGESQE